MFSVLESMLKNKRNRTRSSEQHVSPKSDQEIAAKRYERITSHKIVSLITASDRTSRISQLSWQDASDLYLTRLPSPTRVPSSKLQAKQLENNIKAANVCGFYIG